MVILRSSVSVLKLFTPLLKVFLTPEPLIVGRLSGKTVLALKNRILMIHREEKQEDQECLLIVLPAVPHLLQPGVSMNRCVHK